MAENDDSNNRSDSPPEEELDRLIESNEWDRVYDVIEKGNSNKMDRVRSIASATRLHWICATGSAPSKLIDLVASLDPHAISLPDKNRYDDTPLHIVARNSQTSSAKMKILIKYLKQYDPRCESLLLRTQFGGNVLHSAANHNALLEVLQLIVFNNPNVLKARTVDGMYAVSALWTSYIQTIPGYMIVARILDGDADALNEGHFNRFWMKAEFLASEYFALTRSAPKPSLLDSDNDKNKKKYVLHGLLQCISNVAINFFKVALRQPNTLEMTTACDNDGNLPLHRLLRDRPFRLKEVDAIQDLVNANTQALSHRNNDGDTPLTIAIHNKMSWECIDILVSANPDTVRRHRDRRTGLYPFQLAAFVGGGNKYALETTYQLLLVQPDLLFSSSPPSSSPSLKQQ